MPPRGCRAAGPDAPRKHGEADSDRRDGEPRPPARPRGDERGGEHARGEQDAFALRVHRAGEQHRRSSEAPARRVAEPQREQQGRDHDEHVEEDVRERLQQPLAEARDDENEEQGAARSATPGRGDGEAGGSGDGADDEQPELHVQRGRVRAAHRMEGRRVEDRLQRRVRRVRRRREDVLVETVEEEDRLALRDPERPRVVRLEAVAGAPRGTATRGRAPRARRPPPRRARPGRGQTRGAALGSVHLARRAGSERRPRRERRATPTISTPPNGTPATRSVVHSTPNAATPSRYPSPASRSTAPHVRKAPSPQRSESPTTAYARLSAASPESARTVTTIASGSRALARSPPRRAARPGMRSGRRRSRGSTARPDPSCGAGGSTACSSRARRDPRGRSSRAAVGRPPRRTCRRSGIRPRASIAIAWAGSTELPPPSARSMLSSRAFARAARFASRERAGIEPRQRDDHDSDAEENDDPTECAW